VEVSIVVALDIRDPDDLELQLTTFDVPHSTVTFFATMIDKSGQTVDR